MTLVVPRWLCATPSIPWYDTMLSLLQINLGTHLDFVPELYMTCSILIKHCLYCMRWTILVFLPPTTQVQQQMASLVCLLLLAKCYSTFPSTRRQTSLARHVSISGRKGIAGVWQQLYFQSTGCHLRCCDKWMWNDTRQNNAICWCVALLFHISTANEGSELCSLVRPFNDWTPVHEWWLKALGFQVQISMNQHTYQQHKWDSSLTAAWQHDASA